MQLLMALTTALSSAGSFFGTSNATDQKNDFTPFLVCIDEIQGTFEGVEYDQPQRVVDCGRTVTYCQKITAHYSKRFLLNLKFLLKVDRRRLILGHYDYRRSVRLREGAH
ncbi:hypothetical protein ANCCAN_18842 [Ancylostoma caninum]|uniref:Secreted protein n=1 Tax=Ancylostoma caninum TaxID=29170 RepID=A0A368FWY0_ANCCA|nr:hypothetical protein ANCCAN_18842 [Ancylostoma caninum]